MHTQYEVLRRRGRQISATRIWALCPLAIAALRVLTDAVTVGADKQIELTAVLWAAPEGGYCALNPETGTVSQGETEAEALANLTEATTLYLEEFPLVLGQKPSVTTFRVADIA